MKQPLTKFAYRMVKAVHCDAHNVTAARTNKQTNKQPTMQINTTFHSAGGQCTPRPHTHTHMRSGTFRLVANIGVARGCSGCTYTPRAVKKFLGIIYRENV